MFGRRLTLFKLFGFAVHIDLSWVLIVVLVTWSLATGLFPAYFPDLAPATYWLMGVAGAIGLFASIILHELCHSLVARRYGLPMKGITLFVFGGVAEMTEEPDSPKTEFLMAVAGPVSSLILAGIFLLLYVWGGETGWPPMAAGVIGYLAFINGLLAAFNLLPAFPLDGGRILRSALWRWKGDLRLATRWAANVGSGFGLALVALGLLNMFAGNFIGGLWYFVIGLFLRGAAQMSYRQVLIRQAFEGEPVRRIMSREPVTAPPGISVRELVEDYVYRHHHKMYPVQQDGRLIGCVTTRRIREVPREEWEERSVADILSPCSEENTVGPDTDILQALAIMKRSGNSRLLVAEEGELVGVVSLKDILSSFSTRMELEEEDF